MRYMFTITPDDLCHEIEGVYGRPVHKDEEPALKAKGWVFNSKELQNVRKQTEEKGGKENPVKEESKEKALNDTQKQALELGIDIYDDDGKEIHYRTLGKLIKEKS